MAREFEGKIELDIRDSTPDWDAFLSTRAPEGAPNVLVVLYDDTGQAAWSPYGGRIEMPTMDRLAKNGLTYTQWHTTSPWTRSTWRRIARCGRSVSATTGSTASSAARRTSGIPSWSRTTTSSINLGNFDEDRWQLFHADEDRAEAHDLAEQHPEKVEELKALWLEEAKKYDVLPLNDLSIPEFHKLEYHGKIPPSGRYTYYPGTTEVPEASAAPTLGRSFKILAEVELTRDSKGVIVAQEPRFGGYSLFLTESEVVFVYNFLGIPPEQRLAAPKPAPGRHVVGVEFVKESIGEDNECLGTMTLHVDDEAVADGPFRTQTGRYALAGEGLCVGYDSGDRVSREYEGRNRFTSGEIVEFVYDVGDDAYVDVELKFAAAFARD